MLKYYYFIISLFETFLNILIVSILNLRYLFFLTCYPKRKFNTIQVLGNGPSLENDFPQILRNRDNSAILVVNTFSSSRFYEIIKPEYYVIVDPSFFSFSSIDRVIKIQELTVKALVDKTNWKLDLFVPFSVKDSSQLKKIKNSNSNINVILFKNVPVIGGSQLLNDLFFKFNFANPLYVNVLIPSLFISIKMGFSVILLYGADISWHENYVLGKDNYIYRNDKHFFSLKNTDELIILTKADGSPIHVHEEFLNISNVLKTFHSINSFSNKYNSKIINLSSKTWIDAFPRL